MSKRIIFLIIFLGICVVLFIFLALFSKQPTSQPTKILPTPTIVQNNNGGNSGNNTKTQQELEDNYRQQRGEFLQQKPWVLSMPLRADNYFIFYDSGTDQIIVKLYITTLNEPQKTQEKNQALGAAQLSLKKIGVKLETQKISYVEKLISVTPAP
ncbi:MAG: hypothetical protein Q8P10_03575 [bacterium]|nr:hypothetical protein [bacterium]